MSLPAANCSGTVIDVGRLGVDLEVEEPNLPVEFAPQWLQKVPLFQFMTDMKVQVGDVFYYPDVMTVCEHIDPDSLFQTQPVLLVEVLSSSTESKDRLEKLVAYQSIPSVREYALVSQDKVSI